MGIIERFVALALRQRLFVLLCLAGLTLGGVLAFKGLTTEAFPDLTNNQVVVVATAPGLAATEVEQRVSYPVETALMGVPGAQEVRSTSKFELSIVTVVFDDSVPIYFARQLINERLLEARDRLPEGVSPTLGPVATAFGEIYQYLVEGDGVSPMDRKTIHDWDIRTRLRSVPGVSEINSWGGETRQFQIVVDPARLERYGLTLRQVFDAVHANNASFSGGFIEHHAERYTVRGLGLATGIRDLGGIVVSAGAGVPVLVRDVADIEIGAMPRQGAVTRDGKGETVTGMVIMLKGENGKTVAERAKARLAEIAATLPKGLSIVPFYDQTEVIDATAKTVQRNLLEGSLLVVTILFLFLRDIRASLITAAVIPFSLLFAFIGMRIFGVSANLMSIGAIDFGLLVDGAVVMVENLVRRGQQHAQEPAPAHPHHARMAQYTAAATEVARPILFGVLIILAVDLPIFTLQGLEGKMFRPMAITVCSAILGSLLLSLTTVPVVASYLLKVGSHDHEGRWFERLRALYGSQLASAMQHRGRTIAVALVAVTAAFASFPYLGTEFMPKLDEGSILIETRKLPSVSLEESIHISTHVETLLRAFPEVRQVVTKIGRPDLATEAMGIYQGDVYVLLHPHSTWTTGRTKEQLIDAMAARLATQPGVTYNFTQPMAMRLDEVVSGVKADVAVKIFGPDIATLERLGRDVQTQLARVQGVADLQVEALTGAIQIQIELEREKMARYGISVDEVRTLIESAIGGSPVTDVLDGTRRFPVVVRFPASLRANLAALQALPVVAPGGERIPLSSVARITQVQAPEAVSHDSSERRLVVQANVRGRDVGGFVGDAQQKIAAAVPLPTGYHLEWGGQFENQDRAMKRLTLVIPLSLAIIFLLLFATFGRVRQALLIILNVPFATVGGIAVLWLRDLNLSLSAAIGFITLSGVAVLNGVVLVSAVNRLREEGRPLREAILEGAGTRLKPVLMTALVAAFGFIPMAISTGAGAEVQRPLATVVIGGIITATLLTLIVLPTLYEVLETWASAREQD